ncbi:MAG: protein-methionine-sulfoxide reductase catalytic subunit MsrP [Lysobacter sp.]|nr:MAG: protein-methionine-sulfoxide reductase catalytic subunit MsrP [Lysobacter sp.]
MPLDPRLRAALRLPAAEITEESAYRAFRGDRRRFLGAVASGSAFALAGCDTAEPPPPAARPKLDPARIARGFATDEAFTRYEDATTYNNFYEFGTDKADPANAAKTLRTRPWSVAVSGECAKPGTLDLDALLKGLTAEERIYRMRCVEGWSMVIPWLGVPLGEVLKRFEPTSKAKYVAFTSLADPEQMPGVRYDSIDWPYREGLRIDEAMHPLTLLATGLYGKPLPQQNGAPLRLVVPWKYGFKGIKSIVEIRFVESLPVTAWNQLQPEEYGFFSNVNPDVDHPRWSQASERRIAGTASKLFAERIPTRLFNGYQDQVAELYTGMDLRQWF